VLTKTVLIRFKSPHYPAGFLHGIGVTCAAEPKEFDHIQAPFTQFQTPNQTAFAVEFLGQLSLRQSRFPA